VLRGRWGCTYLGVPEARGTRPALTKAGITDRAKIVATESAMRVMIIDLMEGGDGKLVKVGLRREKGVRKPLFYTAVWTGVDGTTSCSFVGTGSRSRM
jgi:hypothetical protein